MKVSDFLEKTKGLSGNSLVYISCHEKNHTLEQLALGYYDHKETYLHKITVGTDRFALYCDIIWSFNKTNEQYNICYTTKLREVRGYSFDTSEHAIMVSGTDDNASGFHEIEDLSILKNADYGEDVVVLFL